MTDGRSCLLPTSSTRALTSAKRWADRYAAMGAAGIVDRSPRPHHYSTKTPQGVVRRVVYLRWKKRLGPVGIGAKVGMPASTVHAVLVRCRLNKLHHVDVRTGEVVRRYEHDNPVDLIHVDVKKLGNIPDGGGYRYMGRQQGLRNRAATPGEPTNARWQPKIGTSFVHTDIDDHSRVAYAEIHGGGIPRHRSSMPDARASIFSAEHGGASDPGVESRGGRPWPGCGAVRSL